MLSNVLYNVKTSDVKEFIFPFWFRCLVSDIYIRVFPLCSFASMVHLKISCGSYFEYVLSNFFMDKCLLCFEEISVIYI